MERKREEGEPAVPELFVERAALGEATAAEQQRLAALGSEPLQAQLRQLEESNAEILARYPAKPFAQQVERRADAERRQAVQSRARWIPLTAAATCGVAAVVGLLLVKGPYRPGRSVEPTSVQTLGDDDGEIRLKGQKPQLLLYRQEGAKSSQLRDGSVGHAGDLIQLGYVAAGQRHGALLSIDGRGGVTLHAPATAEAPTALERRGKTMLDRSFRLDDAPGFERFFFVTAEGGQALSVAALLQSARQLAADPTRARLDPLPLPPSLQQSSLLLSKP